MENRIVCIPLSFVRDRRLDWRAKILALELYALWAERCKVDEMRKRTGMTEQDFEAACQQLLDAGYLSKNGDDYLFSGWIYGSDANRAD